MTKQERPFWAYVIDFAALAVIPAVVAATVGGGVVHGVAAAEGVNFGEGWSDEVGLLASVVTFLLVGGGLVKEMYGGKTKQ